MSYTKSVQVTIPLPLLYSYCRQYSKYIPPLYRPTQLLIENYCSDPYQLQPAPKSYEKRSSFNLSFRIPFGQFILLKETNPQLSLSAAIRSLLRQNILDTSSSPSDLKIYKELATLLPKEFQPQPMAKAKSFSDEFSSVSFAFDPEQIDLKQLIAAREKKS